MAKKRQRRSAQFKFQVALEALKEQKTLSQLASEDEVHPTDHAVEKAAPGGWKYFVQPAAPP